MKWKDVQWQVAGSGWRRAWEFGKVQNEAWELAIGPRRDLGKVCNLLMAHGSSMTRIIKDTGSTVTGQWPPPPPPPSNGLQVWSLEPLLSFASSCHCWMANYREAAGFLKTWPAAGPGISSFHFSCDAPTSHWSNGPRVIFPEQQISFACGVIN